ncbi:hypothetical protein [Spirillospora sp. CA-294931]|uniref:hypothetical protein n=1 Tax=Spirillospora sp. CA-294931 TaxID=3240042 RepID=UPI003D8ADECD
MISIRRKPQQVVSPRLGRVQEAWRQGAQKCREGASGTAQRMAPAAQHGRDVAADRVLVARGWGAPRLKRAARYVESDLAPRVSSLLSDAAQRVEPAKPARRGRTAALTMLAGVTAIGLAGAVMTRRGNNRLLAEDPVKPTDPEVAEMRADGHVAAP